MSRDQVRANRPFVTRQVVAMFREQDGNGDGFARAGELGEDRFKTERLKMVDEQIRRRGIRDPRVLEAMERVPRHLFVSPGERRYAYNDNPLPIGHGQTISQPYIVALMTELLELKRGDRVLEIGAGSGYQTAVLSLLAGKVFSIERVEQLGVSARERLDSLGFDNVEVRVGDGYAGWSAEAPFDSIIVTAAPETVPQALIEQLTDGGRMAIPVGLHFQELFCVVKEGEKTREEKIANVRFVPMVGEDED